MLILVVFLNVLLVGLFLYSKLLPYKDLLNPQYKSVFNFFDTVFSPVLNFLKSVISPFTVGVGLSVDMTQVVLFIVLLVLVNLF